MSTTSDVRSMYESHPYPSPLADTPNDGVADIMSAWFKGDDFKGKKILEAGCGSGHRLVAVARRYPNAKVLGIDISRTSLKVARDLAKKYNVTNIEFREENLLNFDLGEKFDFIICAGVIHHTENPAASLENVCNHLSKSGSIFIWVYHSCGEHKRLLERELLHRLWVEGRDDLNNGIDLMNELALNLDTDQYSTDELFLEGYGEKLSSAWLAKNVDAYLNPIVNAYRTEPALELFSNCSIDWVAVESFSTVGAYQGVNLGDCIIDPSRDLFPVIKNKELLKSDKLLSEFQKLDNLDKSAVMELLLFPTGMGIVAGKGNSYRDYPERIEGNLICPLVTSSRLKTNYMITPQALAPRK
ncbi:MAG: class I SAM-dependent methyltransferase [Exilibacterium sp.]